MPFLYSDEGIAIKNCGALLLFLCFKRASVLLSAVH